MTNQIESGAEWTERLPVVRRRVLLEASASPFESRAVLNPAVVTDAGTTHMWYRAVDDDLHSSIGYAAFDQDNRLLERAVDPVLYPEHDYERAGLEDPRITKIDDTYYLTYVAFDGHNARIAYATSSDLIRFEKQGIISPEVDYARALELFEQQGMKADYHLLAAHYVERRGSHLVFDKDAVLFPEKIDGQYAMLHRILPDIQIVRFDSFAQLQQTDFWVKELTRLRDRVVLENDHPFESDRIGSGCPPIRVPEGWLLLYHGVELVEGRRVYSAAAALLDGKDPSRPLAKLERPLFSPEQAWERRGDVANVVFPTGTAIDGDRLIIYYGAADSRIGAAEVSLSQLRAALRARITS